MVGIESQKNSQIVLGDVRSISIKTSGVSSDISGWGQEGTEDSLPGAKSPQISGNRVMVRKTENRQERGHARERYLEIGI
jgi:hypothetical protein